jgi:hypothetical protein
MSNPINQQLPEMNRVKEKNKQYQNQQGRGEQKNYRNQQKLSQ